MLVGLLTSAVELVVYHRLLVQLLLHLVVIADLLVYMLRHHILLLFGHDRCCGDLFKNCCHVSHGVDNVV